MEHKKRVLVVGSAEESGGGVATVIRTMKKMPVWDEFHCRWLGTQIQRNSLWKLWYAIKANFIALFIVWRYDIVHFHTVPDRICLVIQMPIFLLALLGRKRIVMHIHMGNQLRNHTGNRLFLWCLRRADLIVFLAQKWKSLFLELYGSIKTPTAVLYNACDMVPKIPFGEKESIILMAAYFDENKAPDLLLKAWKMIKEDYPDWKVYMLGNGEVEKYQRMSKDMGLEDSVVFTGYLRGEEKEDIFRRASIYCMCSYEEGFPMVVLEAWTHGIAVISTPVGGLPDVMEEGKNVLSFGFGDWQGLTKQLKRLMDDETLRKEMADYSYEFVEKIFSPKSVCATLRGVYEDID